VPAGGSGRSNVREIVIEHDGAVQPEVRDPADPPDFDPVT
jgi:hypothetical protein